MALSAKEAARELGTDARTFRKFMRATTDKDAQPGQGGRYNIEEKSLKKLKKKFAEWQTTKPTAAESNGHKTVDEEIVDLGGVENPEDGSDLEPKPAKSRRKKAEVEAEEIEDIDDLNLVGIDDLEGPTDEELEALVIDD